MSAVGTTVEFQDWDDATGDEITVRAVVEAEFTEPLEEDRLQRLNYRVRTPAGQVYTPYADECRPVSARDVAIRAVAEELLTKMTG